MSKNIDISVIIPFYNGKKYIKETIDSLAGISHSKEIIIVDDGSVDDSFDYLSDLCSSNSDIELFRKSNGGIVDARNYGISKASGAYLMFCDQDDIVVAETIDKALDIGIKQGNDCVLWSTERLIDEDTFTKCDIIVNNIQLSLSEIRNYLIPHMLVNKPNKYISYLGHVWAGIYKKELVDRSNIRFKRFVDIEDDYLFVFDFLGVASSIYLCSETGYIWRFNRHSETFRVKYVDNMLKRYECLYEYILNRCMNLNIYEKDFEIYSVQNRIVMCVENCFQYFNKNKTEKRELKYFYSANRSFFKGNSIEPYVKRRKRIYFLLSKGLFKLSGLYVYFDSSIRKVIVSLKK